MQPTSASKNHITRQSRLSAALWLALFILAGATFVFSSIDKVQSGLYWMRRIRGIQPDEYDRLMIFSGVINDANVRGCQTIWQSQVASSIDLDRAYQLILNLKDCARDSLSHRWKGNLAWLMGDTIQARREWEGLPPSTAFEWGRMLFRLGETERSITLLELALQQGEGQISTQMRANAYQILGERYSQTGDWERSAHYFEQALLSSPLNYYLSFQASQAFARAQMCERAIEVLEAGRTVHDNVFRPQLDISYSLQLGECYADTGNVQKALDEVQVAMNLLEKASPTANAEVLAQFNSRLEKLELRLKEMPVP